MLCWHALVIEPRRHKSARGFLTMMEFEPLIPMDRVRRGGKTVEVPRYGEYIFARFDPVSDPWGHLMHSKAKRAGIVRLFCTVVGGEWRPSTVPDKAIAVVVGYEPPIKAAPAIYRFVPGEPCVRYIAGVPFKAVFVEYLGTRQFVRTWIFGSQRMTEVSAVELEPLTLDNSTALTASSGP